jgi:hypothetical protein
MIGNLAIAIALAAVGGLFAAAVIGALLTGTIDGPGHGRDIVSLAERPATFWFCFVAWSVVAVSAIGGAFAYWRKAVAP